MKTRPDKMIRPWWLCYVIPRALRRRWRLRLPQDRCELHIEGLLDVTTGELVQRRQIVDPLFEMVDDLGEQRVKLKGLGMIGFDDHDVGEEWYE
jgi:hypothetical protein